MSRRLKVIFSFAALSLFLLFLHSSSNDPTSYLTSLRAHRGEAQRKLQLRASLDLAADEARATASVIRLPPKKKLPQQKQHPLTHTGSAAIDELVKQYPVIIFSKSYCGFSAKAKTLLLETYKIDPAPFVVELDLVDGGAELQADLLTVTGRSTVPVGLSDWSSMGAR